MSSFSKEEAKQYFHRIGIDCPEQANVENLNDIVKAQIQSIPFENFDLMLGRGTDLDPQVVFSKMVLSQRGGCCFELNGLLKRALDYLGYQVTPLLARVHWRGDPGPRTHMLLLVNINGNDWLADVGFGGPGLLEPITFECDTIFEQRNLKFRVMESPEYHFMLQSWHKGNWKNVYSFDLTVVNDIDIEMANFFVTHYPASFFTTSRIATLPTAAGRVTLVNFTLTEKGGKSEGVIEFEDDETYLEALEQHLGIELNVEYQQLKSVTLNS